MHNSSANVRAYVRHQHRQILFIINSVEEGSAGCDGVVNAGGQKVSGSPDGSGPAPSVETSAEDNSGEKIAGSGKVPFFVREEIQSFSLAVHKQVADVRLCAVSGVIAELPG